LEIPAIGGRGIRGIIGNRIEGTVHGIGGLGEKHRIVRQFGHGHVGTRVFPFFEMFEVVPADGVDVALRPRNG
jgi:hypothetical protein